MGSLVPGWDTPAGTPKDLLEAPDVEPANEGYFAKLEKQRSMRQAGSLSRVSAPVNDLKRDSLGAYSTGSPTAATQRRISQDHAYTTSASIGHPQQKYHGTDWSSELNTLRPKVDYHRNSSGAENAPKHDGWWTRMDAGAMNEADKFTEDRAAARGAFKPQYDITGQHHFESIVPPPPQ